MVNYACAFSQSDLGKYFEWLITDVDVLRQNPSGNWVILIFSGQKPCTHLKHIAFFCTFSRAKDIISHL